MVFVFYPIVLLTIVTYKLVKARALTMKAQIIPRQLDYECWHLQSASTPKYFHIVPHISDARIIRPSGRDRIPAPRNTTDQESSIFLISINIQRTNLV